LDLRGRGERDLALFWLCLDARLHGARAWPLAARRQGRMFRQQHAAWCLRAIMVDVVFRAAAPRDISRFTTSITATIARMIRRTSFCSARRIIVHCTTGGSSSLGTRRTQRSNGANRPALPPNTKRFCVRFSNAPRRRSMRSSTRSSAHGGFLRDRLSRRPPEARWLRARGNGRSSADRRRDHARFASGSRCFARGPRAHSAAENLPSPSRAA